MIEIEFVSTIRLLMGSCCATVAGNTQVCRIIRCTLHLGCSNGYLVISRGILPGIIYVYCGRRISLCQFEVGSGRFSRNLRLAARTVSCPNFIALFPKILYGKTSRIGYIKRSAGGRFGLCVNIDTAYKRSVWCRFFIILFRIIIYTFFIGASYGEYHKDDNNELG